MRQQTKEGGVYIYIYMYTYTEDEKDEPTAIDIVNMTISGNSSNELPGTNSGVFHPEA